VVASGMTESPLWSFAPGMDPYSAGKIQNKWPNLRFGYTHCGAIDGNVLEQLTGIYCLHLKTVPGLTTANSLSPPLSTVCKMLELEQCADLVDLDGLQKCDNIVIRGCPSISRVNMLTGIQRLHLFDCEQISSNDLLYQLDKIPNLVLSNAGNIRAVGQLGGGTVWMSKTVGNQVRRWNRASLILEGYPQLRELRGLGTVHTLTIRRCPAIIDVAPLRNVHTLVLEDCLRLRDISALSRCIDVTLNRMPRVDDVRALMQCRRVCLQECNAITDIRALANVHSVEISDCNRIGSLVLHGCFSVHIRNCAGLSDLQGLVRDDRARCTVSRLHIENCENVLDISPVNGAREVLLKDLHCVCNAADVLESCGYLNVINCPNVEECEIVGRNSTDPMHVCKQSSTSVSDSKDTRCTLHSTELVSDLFISTKERDSEDNEAETTDNDDSVEFSDMVNDNQADGAFKSALATPSEEETAEMPTTGPKRSWWEEIVRWGRISTPVVRGSSTCTSPKAPSSDMSQSTSKLQTPQSSDLDRLAPASRTLNMSTSQDMDKKMESASETMSDESNNKSTHVSNDGSISSPTLLATGPAAMPALSEFEQAQLALTAEKERQDLESLQAFTAFSKLGHDARRAKELSSAVAFFYKALSIARGVKGEQCEEVGNIYVNLGILYGQQRNHEKEMEYFQKALPVFLEVTGANSKMVAMTYNNLGIACRNAQEYTRSMMYFQKALKTYTKIFGSDHEETIRTRRNVDRLVRVATRHKSAAKLQELMPNS